MAITVARTGALKFFNCAQRALSAHGYETSRQWIFPRSWNGRCNAYGSDAKAEQASLNEGPGLNPKKKKVFVPRVTLLSEADEISVVTLDMADRIAKRRNLKLVKILDFDAKTERPTYKLMSTKEYIQEGTIRKTEKRLDRDMSIKGEKMLTVSTNISDHDLQVKLKQIVKFLTKKHEVRFVISVDGNEERCTEICAQLEAALKDLSVTVHKSKAGNKMKIHLRPNVESAVPVDSEIEAKETKD